MRALPMRTRPMIARALLALIALALLGAPASAYIGPGAGLAVTGGLLVTLGTFLMAFGLILVGPFKAAYRMAFPVKLGPAKARRVVVVGLDGFDPGLARKYMSEGRMPNLSALQQEGCFSELDTSYPSISPVAWSTFATGVDASRHNI